MVSNVCKTEGHQKVDFESLFDTQEKITKTFNLLPEYKHVNYLLKIDNEFNFKTEKNTINHILGIPQIATAYGIDPNQLKSKNNLIFS